jgi:hypothetical protein
MVMTSKYRTFIFAGISVLWLGGYGLPALGGQGQAGALSMEEATHPNTRRHFDTAEAAAAALVSALDRDDVDALLDIFGRDNADLVLGSDPASGRVARQRARALAKDRLVLDREGDDRAVLTFGQQIWPMPIPLVRDQDGWGFDTAAGIEEIQARRIGENELSAIDTLRAFVQAQHNYAVMRRDEGKPVEYARYVQSTPGTTDGLWWPEVTAAAAGSSPLANYAARNQEFLEGRRPGDPFKGYYYRLLRGQGRNAPGGAMSYMEDDRLAKGFAIIAWPADYRVSGVMSFLVDRAGRVLQKDLGEETASLVQTIRVYDPDAGWKRVD